MLLNDARTPFGVAPRLPWRCPWRPRCRSGCRATWTNLSSLARLADRYGDDDDDPSGDELLAVFETHQQQSVVDDADHQRADDRADHGAGAAEEARAAEHCGRDDGEFVALAELEAARVQAAGVQHPSQGGAEARDDQDAHLDALRVDAAIARRGFAAAGGQHSPAEGRAAQHHVSDDGDDCGPDDQHGNHSPSDESGRRLAPRWGAPFAPPRHIRRPDPARRRRLRLAGQPGLGGRWLSIRQQRDRLSTFKITDQRSISMVATPGPVVDPDDHRGREARVAPSAHGAQQSVVADRYAQAAREARRRSTSKGDRQTMDNLIEPSRAPRPGLEDVVVEAFGEDAPLAKNLLAAKASRLKHQHGAPPCDRQVRQTARILTVDPARNRATRWARTVRAQRADCNDGAVAFARRANRARSCGEQL